jgi:hypothetical protein
MARKSGVATLTTSSPHGLSIGNSVTVSGVGSGFDGTFTVTAVGGAGSMFSYNNAGTDLPTITSKQLTSGVATLTTSTPHTLSIGDSVTVSGIDSVFNGTFSVTAVPTPTSFSYSISRGPFTRSVSKKGLQHGVATLTTTVAHGLVVGDIINVSGVDALLNGGPFTVTSVPTTTTLTYADSATTNLSVSHKALSNGTTATLTTSAAHHLVAGDSVKVTIGDSRFDGTQTVLATPAPTATTFSYTVPAVVANVTNKAVASGTATLTTSSAPQFQVGDSVTINTVDPRFDGTFAVTAVNAAAKTFSYTPSTFQNTSWTWTAASRTVTMTTAAAQGLQPGNTIAVTKLGGAQACLNGTFSVGTVPSTTTFTYTVPSGVTCNPGATGTQKATIAIVTVASTAAGGSATLDSLSTAASGTVTVPAFIPANTTVTPVGTISATGNVAATPTSGSFTPASSPATGLVTTNHPGSRPVPAAYTVPAGTVAPPPLQPGTYYGGICIGLPSGTGCSDSNCANDFTTAAYSPAQTLSTAIGDALTPTITTSGNAISAGDAIQIETERMRVIAVAPLPGGKESLTVERGYMSTTAATHAAGRAILHVTANGGGVNVTLAPGIYIMAGGGFYACGAATVSAPNVMIYNTDDVFNGTELAALGQIELYTLGTVTLGPQTGGLYQGLTIFQDGTQELTTAKCDNRAENLSDIALVATSQGINTISGTIYAPAENALFVDSLSGTANLAVLAGCIFIDGADSTFAFVPSGLFGIGSALGE